MTYATIRSAAEHIARTGKITPHQLAAFSALDQGLTDLQRQGFTDLWRAAGSPAAALFTSAAPFTPSSRLSTLVTPHITYGELCLNEERRRFINQGQCDVAIELCAFLEKARTQFGGEPLIITSCHRPKAVNDAVGGSADSEHLYKPGCGAVDWYIKNIPIKLVQDWCDNNWPFSLGYGAPRGFVHLGIRAGKPKVRWDY